MRILLDIDFELGASLAGTEVSLSLPEGTVLVAEGEGARATGRWEIDAGPGTTRLPISTEAGGGVPELAIGAVAVLDARLAPFAQR